MKCFRATIALFLLAVTLSAVSADARNNGWDLLGKRSVQLYGDHDVIPVTAARGDFRRIFLRMRGNGLFMNTMTVTYANGAPDRIPITYYIPEGGQTRAIDLRGYDRFIRRVDLSYRRVPNNRGRAVVELWGRH
jgi:hypothetical protein